MLYNINIADLKKLNNAIIIDIRNIEKYNDNHIPGAHNIPFDKLLLYPDKYIDKKQKYYIYCQKGIKSKKICQILIHKGFQVVNIIGGYESWILNE